MTEIETPAAPHFSWGPFIGGLAIALVLGAVGDLAGGLIALSMQSLPAGILMGAGTGMIFIAIGAFVRRRSPAFGTGLLCGGCVIALIGGLCGGAMVGTSFK